MQLTRCAAAWQQRLIVWIINVAQWTLRFNDGHDDSPDNHNGQSNHSHNGNHGLLGNDRCDDHVEVKVNGCDNEKWVDANVGIQNFHDETILVHNGELTEKNDDEDEEEPQ